MYRGLCIEAVIKNIENSGRHGNNISSDERPVRLPEPAATKDAVRLALG